MIPTYRTADEPFLDYVVRRYAETGEELFRLPAWAWLRRRKALYWRAHYASQIADEMEARYVG